MTLLSRLCRYVNITRSRRCLGTSFTMGNFVGLLFSFHLSLYICRALISLIFSLCVAYPRTSQRRRKAPSPSIFLLSVSLGSLEKSGEGERDM